MECNGCKAMDVVASPVFEGTSNPNIPMKELTQHERASGYSVT